MRNMQTGALERWFVSLLKSILAAIALSLLSALVTASTTSAGILLVRSIDWPGAQICSSQMLLSRIVQRGSTLES
jgi:hypothetical protein